MVRDVEHRMGPGIHHRRGRAGQLSDRWLERELVAATRVGYSLGRIWMLQRVLTRIHPVFKNPSVAVHAQAVLAISYALILGFALGSPVDALVPQGTISTVLIVAIYICTGVSCTVFYLREHRSEFNVLLHPLIPLAA
jgi:amino acid transporter